MHAILLNAPHSANNAMHAHTLTHGRLGKGTVFFELLNYLQPGLIDMASLNYVCPPALIIALSLALTITLTLALTLTLTLTLP